MALAIPCTPNGSSRWTQRVSLEGRDYQLAFQWSQRAGGWSLTLSDQDGAAIRSGMGLVVNRSLLKGCIDPRRPPGAIVLGDTQRTNDVDPGFDDLGTRFVLIYFTADEVLAAAAG